MSISLHRAMRIIPLALLLLSCSFVFSQTQGTFPVQVNCFFIPPHSLYISDYYAAERERVAVTLINRDMSTPMLSVRLRVFINGPQGVRLMSDPYINTEPIILDAGVPQRLTFDDLRPYVASMNVNAVPQGKFAEGVLEYCVQVVDANTGRILSLPSCARAHISNPAPPMLMLPRNKEAMVFRDPVSIMFQWTPRSRHIASVEYEFVLKEILDNDIPPQAAFLYSPELVRETVTTTNFIYNINYPMLLPGKRYAWAVQARTRDGFDNRNPFQNNGWTEIWWFTLQDKCDPVRVVNATTARRKLTLNWIGLPTHTSFVVSYRLSTTSRNDNWKEVSTDEASLVLNGLKEGGTYEYRIGSICQGGQPVFSEPFKATLPKVDSIRQARCGMMPVVNLSNREPLKEFIIGESFMAGDFPIYVTSLESTRSDNGVYTGRGWTTLPWLVNARIAVEFRNITINSDGQMIEGFVEAMYDKNEGNIANLDALTHGGTGVGEVKDGRASAEYTVEYTIKGTDAFTLNAEEDLVITDSEGVAHTLQIEERTDNEGNKFKVFPVTVKDKDGKIYKVEEVVERDAAGNEKKTAKATLIGEQLAGFDPSQIRTTQLDGDVALVTFKQGKGRYAFDTWDERFETSTLIAPKYERVFREYYTPFKLVPTGKTDVVEASLEIKDTAIVASKIKFVTKQGTAYQSTWNENTKTFEIQLTGGAAGDGQELFAIHPKKSNNTSNSNNNNNNSSTSYYTLGKLKVMSYAEKSYKLNLVTVNNAKADVNAYATKLNEIYGPLGITWQVSSDNISYTGQLKDFSNRTGLSTYNETMRALNAAYREKKGESFDKSASVLFIIPESVSGSDEDRRGFMPRRSQFGYLMDGELSASQAPIRAAHELGHGRFTLYHTFDDTYGVTRTMGETSNLMDYNGGTHLAKWQWDVVHDPALVPGVFEGDGNSAMIEILTAEEPSTTWEDVEIGDNIRYIYCFTPAGKVFALPSGAKLNFTNSSTVKVPYGSLVSYELDGKQYFGKYEKKNNKWYFIGYFTKEGSRGYSYVSQEQLEAQTGKADIQITTASLNGALVIPLEQAVLQRWTATLGAEAAKNLKTAGRVTVVTIAASMVLELFISTSSLEYGVGEVVLELPLPAIAVPDDENYVTNPPTTLPIAIPHAIQRNKGRCGVYIIWGVRADDSFVAKYGMTCQDDYDDRPDCNPRPDLQCNKFRRENTDPTILDYNYSWVIRDVDKPVAIVVERSMTASYVIAKKGKLPPNHYLPCFIRKDDFDERVDRATEWIHEQLKKFGK